MTRLLLAAAFLAGFWAGCTSGAGSTGRAGSAGRSGGARGLVWGEIGAPYPVLDQVVDPALGDVARQLVPEREEFRTFFS